MRRPAPSRTRASAPKTVVGIVSGPIPVARVLARLGGPGHGAQTVFIGTVRGRNLGRRVRAITYEIHAPLARKVFERIVREARARWGRALSLALVHRRGRLRVGEASVLAAALSPHRAEAFAACRFLIDETKRRAPVWKKEHFESGDSAWVRGRNISPNGSGARKGAVRS